MNDITLLRDSGPEAPSLTTAARHAARAALLEEIERSATVRGRLRDRLPSRKAGVRIGAGITVAAVAWAAAVVITGPDPVGPHAGGITLVAAEEITFPLSLDPEPADLTRALSGGPGLPFASADYRSADGAGFNISIFGEDPRRMEQIERIEDSYANWDIAETGTVTVTGTEAEFVRGDFDEHMCTYAPSTPVQTEEPAEVCLHSFVDLFWERQAGQWVWIRGEDAYAGTAAVVDVAESIVDRPQAVGLQLGLTPAGWSVDAYDDSSAHPYVQLVSDVDPAQRVSVSVEEAWRGYTADNMLDDVMGMGPVTTVTVDGRPAQLGFADAPELQDTPLWWLGGQFADGTLFLLQAPEQFTRDDVLAIAAQVTYRP
jgi:hypothetical protein